MKRMVFLLAMFLATTAFSQDVGSNQPKHIGLGVILGEPTGFSGKVNMNSVWAVDFAAAWSFSHEDALHLHADLLHHTRGIFRVENASFDMHFGVGGRTKFNDRSDDNLGIRFPIGLDYSFQRVPIEVFLELAAIMDFVPDTDFELGGGIGGRFFF